VKIIGLTKWLVLAMVPVLILLVSACTAEQQKLVEGVLQNADSVNGTITVVDKSGQTHTITVQAGQIQIDGQSVSLEALEPGTHVKIELESERVGRRVEAELARVFGNITQVNAASSNITIAPQGGGQAVTVLITSATRIKLGEDRSGSFNDLKVGINVEVRYNPDTKVALKVSLGEKENSEIEGNITAVSGSNMTIRTEKGRSVTLTADNTTLIRIKGSTGTVADIKVGLKVNVKFDPFTRIATRIEIQGNERDDRNENSEIEGNITAVSGSNVTIQTEKGRSVILTADNTTLIRIKGSTGTAADIKVGLKVNVKFNPLTMIASRVEIQGNERDNRDDDGKERRGGGDSDIPRIPHTIEGRADCLLCHQTGVADAPRIPADHSGRTNAICQTCHQLRVRN